MNLDSAILILRSSAATTNTNSQLMQWANVNMRQCMGTLFMKYKKFKICLTGVTNYNTVAIATASDRYVEFWMSGLNFIDSGFQYDSTRGGTQTSTTVIGMLDLVGSTNTGRTLNPVGETGACFFIENPERVNIQIEIRRSNDGSFNAAQNYGGWTFSFAIYGIEE